MFSRLLKHEWRANRGLFGILSLAVLGLGIAAAVVMRILVNERDRLEDILEGYGSLLVIAMYMFLFFCVIGLALYAAGVSILLLYRFYKNKFTDEGYLTFTLPVKTTEIFWSSVVNMLLWRLISVVVVAAVVFLVTLFGTASNSLINDEVFEVIGKMFRLLRELNWAELFAERVFVVSFAEMLLMVLVTPLYSVLIPVCCITVGAVLAKKHKILAAFGIYYGVNAVSGILSSVLSAWPLLIFSPAAGNGKWSFAITFGIQLLVIGGLTVGAYFLTIHLMKHKLNLP